MDLGGGQNSLEKVMQALRSHRSPSKQEGLTFAIAELIHGGNPYRERFALFGSEAERIPVHLQVMGAMPEGAADLSINWAESRHHCLDPRRNVFNFSRVDILNLRYALNRPRLQCSTALA